MPICGKIFQKNEQSIEFLMQFTSVLTVEPTKLVYNVFNALKKQTIKVTVFINFSDHQEVHVTVEILFPSNLKDSAKDIQAKQSCLRLMQRIKNDFYRYLSNYTPGILRWRKKINMNLLIT